MLAVNSALPEPYRQGTVPRYAVHRMIDIFEEAPSRQLQQTHPPPASRGVSEV